MNLRQDFFDNSPVMLEQLPRGAFLSVQANGRSNTMTIGWGTVGFIWRKPILMVAVRFSRFTYSLMEATDVFTVSVPRSSQFKKLLAQTGHISGRDMDKFKELQIQADSARNFDSPVISNCGLILECRIVYKQAMDPEALDEEIRRTYYANEDYHMLYFGEVLACYHNDSP